MIGASVFVDEPRVRTARFDDSLFAPFDGAREADLRLVTPSLQQIRQRDLVVGPGPGAILFVRPARLAEQRVTRQRLGIRIATSFRISQPEFDVADPLIGAGRFGGQLGIGTVETGESIEDRHELAENASGVGRDGPLRVKAERGGVVVLECGGVGSDRSEVEFAEDLLDRFDRQGPRRDRASPLLRFGSIRRSGQPHDDQDQRGDGDRQRCRGGIATDPLDRPLDRTDSTGANRSPFQKPIEIIGERRGIDVAPSRIGGQAAEQDRLEVARNRRIDRTRSRDLGSALRRAEVRPRFSFAELPQRHQLVQRGSQAEQIAARGRLSLPLFRSHVAPGTDDLARAADVGVLEGSG